MKEQERDRRRQSEKTGRSRGNSRKSAGSQAQNREPKRDERKAIGRRGEGLAAEFMREKGWEELARNYQLKMGEIDLVMKRREQLFGRVEETVAIIEVKTRTDRRGPPPEASVNQPKRERLVRLAMLFMEREKLRRVNIRFDVISVDLSQDEPAITHFPCAFGADGQIW